RILADQKVRRLATDQLLPGDSPVKGSKPLLRYFAVLGLSDIEGRAIPKLPGAEIFGDASNAKLHIVAFEAQRFSIFANTTQRNVNVGVIRIEMRCSDPFEVGSEIASHALHQVAGELREVDSVSELW